MFNIINQIMRYLFYVEHAIFHFDHFEDRHK